jgi:hypothetical protein
MKHRPGITWVPVYEYLRIQPPGTAVSWHQLCQVAGHNIKAGRTALVRAKQELEKDGLTIGGQSATGIEVVEL